MASAVAWLSFDAEQQRRTQLMLAAFSSQGTIDELGLGIVRDLVARVLHPGLTVLHRRAKYLLFVPRDYRTLSAASVERMVAEGRRAEVRTMRQLVEHYRDTPDDGADRGIIGRRRGELTQQLPSAMYWGLLRQLGILREPGSVADYCRRRVDEAKRHAARGVLHEEGEVVESEAAAWAEIPDGKWSGFALSEDEAQWLRERFLASETRSDDERSLTSWLLDPDRREWWTGVANAWEHPQRDDFPAKTADVMYLGRDLDSFVHSARIAYNYLCAVGRPDRGAARDELVARYEDAMDDWSANVEDNLLTPERLTELDSWARSALSQARASGAAGRWAVTSSFLREWRDVVARSGDPLRSDDARTLLQRRESLLKGGRARLDDPELLRGWAGDSGFFHFDYNWSIAMLICGDIHGRGPGDGLGTPHRSADEAA